MIFTNRWNRQLRRQQRNNEDRLNKNFILFIIRNEVFCLTYFLLSFNWLNKWYIGTNISIKLAKQIRIIPIIDCTPRLLTRINKDIMLTFIEKREKND